MLIKSKFYPLNVVFISNYIDYFLDSSNLFDFEKYFLCGFASSIKNIGNNVTLILPYHKGIDLNKIFSKKDLIKSDTVIISFDREGRDEREVKFNVFTCNGIQVVFIEDSLISERDGFLFDPSNGIFYPDNPKRFSIFAKSSLEALKVLPLKPDIIHVVGEWVSISAIYCKLLYKYDNFFKGTRVIFTVPSLNNQILFPPDQYSSLGIDWKYFSYEYLEFYGKVNILKGGIVFSDLVTFCSESYIEEAKKEEFGNGLEGLIKKGIAENKIRAVIPGVDSSYDPSKDYYLAKIKANYSKDNITEKAKVKRYICDKAKINPNTMVFLFFDKLVESTGISLVYEVFYDLLPKNNISIIIIGKGDTFREDSIRELISQYPGKVTWFSEVSKDEIIYYIAGSDVILIPSISESSTIKHIVSMKYGTLPLVRGVGILNDVVRDKINGFKFYDYLPSVFKEKVEESIEFYFKNPKRWYKFVDTAMKSEFSWNNTAKKYDEIYRELKK
ncbi:MAG: glycogen synthase [Brevinematia bacterium]